MKLTAFYSNSRTAYADSLSSRANILLFTSFIGRRTNFFDQRVFKSAMAKPLSESEMCAGIYPGARRGTAERKVRRLLKSFEQDGLKAVRRSKYGLTTWEVSFGEGLYDAFADTVRLGSFFMAGDGLILSPESQLSEADAAELMRALGTDDPDALAAHFSRRFNAGALFLLLDLCSCKIKGMMERSDESPLVWQSSPDAPGTLRQQYRAFREERIRESCLGLAIDPGVVSEAKQRDAERKCFERAIRRLEELRLIKVTRVKGVITSISITDRLCLDLAKQNQRRIAAYRNKILHNEMVKRAQAREREQAAKEKLFRLCGGSSSSGFAAQPLPRRLF